MHKFCVVPGQRGLCDSGFAIGVKPCKEDGRFYLRRCDRRLIMDAAKCARINLQRRTVIVILACDIGSHTV